MSSNQSDRARVASVHHHHSRLMFTPHKLALPQLTYLLYWLRARKLHSALHAHVLGRDLGVGGGARDQQPLRGDVTFPVSQSKPVPTHWALPLAPRL